MSGFSPDHAGAEVRVSPNFGPRVGVSRPDMIILHYTGMKTGESAEAWLCAPESEVSSHYLVHEDGRIVQMVRESDRAWHAGKSFWSGITDVNSHSIGIEIVNPGHEFGYRRFPARQIAATIDLCRGIAARHEVVPERVLAHSDVAPGRKVDPGEKFPWRQLAQEGVGHFVAPVRAGGRPLLQQGDAGEAVEELQSMLSLYGYGAEITGAFDPATGVLVSAFQRHFRPRRVDGVADRSTVETLRRLLHALPARPV
ncbi:MAG: N-acetylmuramoyl-L-alanine amidase [Rhizobiaceae bacterium]|nr:N-acetylmuramoyl-L-alanine amidase [Rhizobiaceae bacterium]